MPTVFYIGPYRFFFYSKEGREPAHVHVEAGGCEAKIWLQDDSLARCIRFKAHEVNEILRHVRDRKGELQAAWEVHFGERRDD